MTQTVSDAIVGALARHGVRHIFAQSIPSTVLLRCPSAGIEQITYRTENAGGAMADGYARVSGRIGVVGAQNGPAAALLVPPLAEALKASSPVVALVQDIAQKFSDRNAFQDLAHLEMFSSCTKWVRRLTQPDRAADYVDMAVVAATSGRPGPAVLLLPLDVLQEKVTLDAGRDTVLGSYPLDRPVAEPRAVAEAAEVLAASERVLIVAGGGVHGAQAVLELTELQQVTHAAVATTMMGKGVVDESDPWVMGVIGYAMGQFSRTHNMEELIDSADVVMLLGTRTNQNGTDGWKLFRRARKLLHVDIDPLEIGRNYEALRLVGDIKTTLRALIDLLGTYDLANLRATNNEWVPEIAKARQRHSEEVRGLIESNEVPLRPERVMAELDSLLPRDAVVVADASYSTIWIANYLTSRKAGQRFIMPRGLAGLGWGLPMALGVKAAVPDAPVIVISGDGGFGHCWSETETAIRMGLPIVHIVLNNSVLGYQKHGELANWGAHTSGVRLGGVDHAMIARACGTNGVRVEHPQELRSALQNAISSNQPYLVDVIVDSNAYPPITAFDGKGLGNS